jgi:cell division protein FtsB
MSADQQSLVRELEEAEAMKVTEVLQANIDRLYEENKKLHQEIDRLQQEIKKLLCKGALYLAYYSIYLVYYRFDH